MLRASCRISGCPGESGKIRHSGHGRTLLLAKECDFREKVGFLRLSEFWGNVLFPTNPISPQHRTSLRIVALFAPDARCQAFPRRARKQTRAQIQAKISNFARFCAFLRAHLAAPVTTRKKNLLRAPAGAAAILAAVCARRDAAETCA